MTRTSALLDQPDQLMHLAGGKNKKDLFFWMERCFFLLPARRPFGGAGYLMDNPVVFPNKPIIQWMSPSRRSEIVVAKGGVFHGTMLVSDYPVGYIILDYFVSQSTLADSQ